jgi:hypothetical protein
MEVPWGRDVWAKSYWMVGMARRVDKGILGSLEEEVWLEGFWNVEIQMRWKKNLRLI